MDSALPTSGCSEAQQRGREPHMCSGLKPTGITAPAALQNPHGGQRRPPGFAPGSSPHTGFSRLRLHWACGEPSRCASSAHCAGAPRRPGELRGPPLRGKEGARRAKAPGPAGRSSGRGGHTGLSPRAARRAPNGPARRPLTLSCPTSRRNRSRFRAPPPERAAAEADAMRPRAPQVGAGRVAAARSSSPFSASVLPLRQLPRLLPPTLPLSSSSLPIPLFPSRSLPDSFLTGFSQTLMEKTCFPPSWPRGCPQGLHQPGADLVLGAFESRLTCLLVATRQNTLELLQGLQLGRGERRRVVLLWRRGKDRARVLRNLAL